MLTKKLFNSLFPVPCSLFPVPCSQRLLIFNIPEKVLSTLKPLS
ncbi:MULTISPECIES: hypothetical protein [unclassified Moorena]|nr:MULTISPECIES: hypothetical protein [unclassified Moorena]